MEPFLLFLNLLSITVMSVPYWMCASSGPSMAVSLWCGNPLLISCLLTKLPTPDLSLLLTFSRLLPAPGNGV